MTKRRLRVLIEEANAENTPQVANRMLLRRLAPRGHRSSSISVATDLAERLTVADVERFHAQLWQPSKVVFLLSGDISAVEAAQVLNALFEGWKDVDVPAPLERIFCEKSKPGILQFKTLQESVEVDLSWISPVGPLRFAIANPIRKFTGDKIQKFQFQIGTSF